MDNLRKLSPQTGTGIGTDTDTDRKTSSGRNWQHTLLGPYRLERELGRGFSSIVYEATEERRQRSVALKVLTYLPSLSEERRRDLAERFRREAQAVSALSHPNIVAIYDVGRADDGRQYIAMECLPGETLRQRLYRASPLSVREAVAVAARVADALYYAHGRGIVHRDIKPDNIFLARNASAEATPKLMDFGIAHVLSDQGLTQDGTIVGSPAYMSPEQVNGLPLDARTDVFSLAVTVTEMVTGAKPFEGATIPAVMQQILRHTPDLRTVPDRRLRRVLMKALSKNPAGRYPDAAAFAEALRRAVPLAAAAPSIATQIIAETPRRPASAFPRWRAIVLGAAGLSGLALAAWAFGTKHPQPPTHAARPVSSVQLALGTGARRQEIAAWHPLAAHSVRPAHHAAMVRIAEVTPTRPQFPYYDSPYYAHTTRISSVTQPPKSPLAPPPPVALARPALPVKPNPPSPAASPRLAVVRVAGVRQEMTSASRTAPEAIPETEPASTEETWRPPRAIHCPLPSVTAALDSPDTAVRLRLSVNEDGDVTEATILTSSGSRELDDAALDAVGHWGYEPAVQNGQNVPGTVIETVQFSRSQ